MNQPKDVGTFAVKPSTESTFYQYLRIRMIGENSSNADKRQRKRGVSDVKSWSIVNLKGVLENTENKKYVLCCSGIEFFGDIIIDDNNGQNHFGNLVNVLESKQFEYESDFDENGILYHIGSDFGRSSWTNPSRSLAVKVERGKQSEKGSVDHVVDRKKMGQCLFLDYFIIDFRDIRVKATMYTLRSERKPGHCWMVKASNNKRDWIKIREHLGDDDGDIMTFQVECHHFYRYFKVENMTLVEPLHCSGFEIYGEIKFHRIKQKTPQLRSGGNGGGAVSLRAPKCVLNDCLISCNGQNGTNFGGGGAGGNVLIDVHRLELLGTDTRIQCSGGRGDFGDDELEDEDIDKEAMDNDGQNGRIRLFCGAISGEMSPAECCDPKPIVK